MKVKKIPKTIHYCWFGRGEKPRALKESIESWKRVMPDYEIKEWNEDNFDLNKNKFAMEAYEEKKFAFVSDFVRVYVLYNYGGVYMDTDVEAIKTFDDFLDEESFWGFEEKNFIATSTIGAAPKNKIVKAFLDYYCDKTFKGKSGQGTSLTNVKVVSEIFSNLGIVMDGTKQSIEGGTIYPKDYFSPYDYINCALEVTENTVTIHYFYKSWLPITSRVKERIKKLLVKVIGKKYLIKLREFKENF